MSTATRFSPDLFESAFELEVARIKGAIPRSCGCA